MIIGLTGSICAGKHAFAQYLCDKYNFEMIDLVEEFRRMLAGEYLPIEDSPYK